MCLPAATLALVATGISAVGTGIGAIQASNMANYRAKIEERNASIEREAANQEAQNTRDAALQHYRKVAQLKGQQIVGAASNGVVGSFGTAADTLADTDVLATEDAGRIYRQGEQRVRDHDIAAWNNQAQASADRTTASNSLVKGAFDFGSTVLGGAQQYSQLKQKYGAFRVEKLTPSARETITSYPGIF
ncbi:hypothetical protein [Novosphingobium olei]|uniref:hypothetical protein n=1 Tax=Novosphingobium olei TaxID=2728851 RepID=UPI003089AD45|nr:hypothetical protein NSDW_10630 [Novosphingobium olei]